MKVLALVSFTILVAYVQADFLPSQFFENIESCFSNNPDDKRKALQCLAQLVGLRHKREMPTQEIISLAKQYTICMDMGNDKATCHAKFADKIAQFDPTFFNTVVNYEAVLKELNEFLAIYNQGGHTIRETLALMKQNQAQGQRQKREMPQPVQTMLLFHYLIGQCVQKNPQYNYATCALAMFGPKWTNMEELKTKIDEYLKDKKDVLKEFYESTKDKASGFADNVQNWFSDKFGRTKRDAIDKVKGELNDVKDAITLYKDMILSCAKQTSQSVLSCANQLFGPSIKSELEGFADNVQNWFSDKFGRNKRDVIDKVKDELKDVKDAITLYKDMILSCSKQTSQSVVSCANQLFGPSIKSELEGLKDNVQDWFKEHFGRQKREMPTQEIISLAKQFTICMDMGNDKTACHEKFADKIAQFDPTFFNTVVNYEAVLKELNEFLAIYNQGGHTIRETIEIMKQKPRQKRDMPTQEEVGWAKQIKICLDMGMDKDACYDKILGANKANVDLLKLETIGKYEDVLKELRQFLDIYNQGGHTIRETLLLLHKQQASIKNRAFTTPSVQSLMDLKTVVLECMAALPNNDIAKCAIAVFGTQIEGSDKLALVVQLVNHPQVQEFARGAGQKLHAYMQTLDGFVGQVHDWAHSAYDWAVNYFG